MPKDSQPSNREMQHLRTWTTPDLSASTLDGGLLAASRITRATPGHGMSDNHVQEDAFMLCVQLREYRGEIWVDGSKVDFAGSEAGQFTVYDYSREWRADLQSSFDAVNFHISRSALAAIEDEIGAKRLQGFNVAPGANINDPIVMGMVSAIVPIFDGRYETNQLLLDYVGTGLLVHMASTYGGLRQPAQILKGGLTPRQLHRATMLLDANLEGKLNLSDLARECGLSSSYFARAFKVSTGVTPSKWIAQQRIAKAVDMLKDSSLPLREIALRCGFADQAHFTRSFGEAKGTPPAAWRRERSASSIGMFHGGSKSGTGK